MTFKDHFSSHSNIYAKYRPHYPRELYDFILSHVTDKNLAWDCATGSGQAAIAVAPFFEKVIATDASKSQLEHASQHPKVDYLVAPAEHSGLENHSVDLITVAQAIHWFDFDAFYKEVKRVSRPGSILAAWTYYRYYIEPEIDDIIWHYRTIVEPFWPPERQYVEDQYETIPFPFEQIPHPMIEIKLAWNLNDLLGYLNTWSSTQRYLKEKGSNPLLLVKADLEKVWSDPSEKKGTVWPIILKMGYISES